MKFYGLLVVALICALLAVSPAFCQEEKTDMKEPQVENPVVPAATGSAAPITPPPAQTPAPVQVPPTPAAPVVTNPEAQDMSLYGEIKSVDTASNSITVQYYDYDTDEEKTTSITVDDATKLENAKTISEMKQGDWADITYVVADGKNVAKSIIVEKEEATTIQPSAAEPASDFPEEE